MKKIHLIETGIIAILFVIVFAPIYPQLKYRFTRPDSYYSHGFLVPFVSLYLAYKKRDTLRKIVPQSDFVGLIILIGSLIAHVVGIALRINVISYFSIPLVLSGISLYLGGRRFTKEILFPIGFLLFMLPLPQNIIIGISFKLKIIAAHGATLLGNLISIQAERSGSTIYYPGGMLLVGEPCSGLRSLISFLALGALFTQLTDAPSWKRWTLFASTIPIALITNLLRLTFLLVVGYIYGMKATTGFLHDASGFMVFILGFACFIGLTNMLRCRLII